jgi:hypothetical protein
MGWGSRANTHSPVSGAVVEVRTRTVPRTPEELALLPPLPEPEERQRIADAVECVIRALYGRAAGLCAEFACVTAAFLSMRAVRKNEHERGDYVPQAGSVWLGAGAGAWEFTPEIGPDSFHAWVLRVNKAEVGGSELIDLSLRGTIEGFSPEQLQAYRLDGMPAYRWGRLDEVGLQPPTVYSADYQTSAALIGYYDRDLQTYIDLARVVEQRLRGAHISGPGSIAPTEHRFAVAGGG